MIMTAIALEPWGDRFFIIWTDTSVHKSLNLTIVIFR